MKTINSYNEIISPEDQDYLIFARDKTTEMAWAVGDMALRYIDARNDLPVNAIYSAIASFWGRSSRTVRDYARVAKFYPPEIRDYYSVLSFSHMRYACGLENWQGILDWAIRQTDEFGRPATYDSLVAQFGKKSDLDPIGRCINEIQIQFEKLADYLAPEYYERIKNLLEEINKCLIEAIGQGTTLEVL